MSCSANPKDCCRFNPPDTDSLPKLVAWYRHHVLPHRIAELMFYGDPDRTGRQGVNLDRIIQAAVMAETIYGTMDSHQRRVGAKVCLAAADTLRTNESKTLIKAAIDFDALYKIVSTATEGIARFGELARYDTALRLGFYRKLRPKEVYLQRGALAGARALMPGKTGRKLLLREFPSPLCDLAPDDVENFLCICKDQLRKRRR